LIDGKEFRDRMSSLPLEVGPVCQFSFRVRQQPYLSRIRSNDWYLWSGSLRVYCDAQVGKSGGFNQPFRL
jgi:hypothetical protein